MLNNHTAHKYEKRYKGEFAIIRCYTNGMVSLECGVAQITHHLRFIKTYKPDTNVKY